MHKNRKITFDEGWSAQKLRKMGTLIGLRENIFEKSEIPRTEEEIPQNWSYYYYIDCETPKFDNKGEVKDFLKKSP